MSNKDHTAREALRARQGGGARYDAESAPHPDLLLARRGTAYFARKLNELSDFDFVSPSLCPGWERRHLVAFVSLQAQAFAIAIKALRAPLIAEEADWRPDLDLTATLPERALRHLFEHAAKHLDVEWRDLSNDGWNASCTMFEGSERHIVATPLMRANTIWNAAIALGNGGRSADLPDALKTAKVDFQAIVAGWTSSP